MSCGCHQAQHYVNTGKSFFFQKFGKNSYLLYCYEGKKKIEDTKGVTESVSKVKKTNNNKCKEWSTNITQVKQYEQHKNNLFYFWSWLFLFSSLASWHLFLQIKCLLQNYVSNNNFYFVYFYIEFMNLIYVNVL